VRREVKDIARFWLDLGVDGFRLDAAKHIYGDTFGALSENEIRKDNGWWHEFEVFVYGINEDAVIVGEALGDRGLLLRLAWGLEGLLDEPFMNELRAEAGWPAPGFLGRQKQFLLAARDENRKAFPPPLPFRYQPFAPFYFAGSHDRNPRLASDFEDMRRRGMAHDVDQAERLAAYTLLTLGSRPIIYAGDELLQRGWRWNGNPPGDPRNGGDGSGIYDETLREPFPWYRSGDGPGQTGWFAPRFDRPDDGVSREEEDRPGTVFDLIRGLANLRTDHPGLADGDVGAVASDTADWMVFERVSGADRYLVLINTTGDGNTYQFHEGWYPEYIGARLLFWSDGVRKRWRNATADGARIDRSVFVPPFGLIVLRKSS
jgi:glycosidase